MLAATVALASAHMPGEYHPPGAEHGQLERFIEWLPWSSLGRMPPADGARWYADPQTVSNVFLAIIAVLMVFQHVDFFIHFRERRFGPLVRESPLHLRRRSRALVRGLRRRLPRRQPRQPIVFSRARATLDAKLSTMVGLGEVKAHLSNMLDTLEMDARRCAQMPGFVTQRGCMHMVFLGNPGTGKTAVAELLAVLLKEMGLLRRGHLVITDLLLARGADLAARTMAPEWVPGTSHLILPLTKARPSGTCYLAHKRTPPPSRPHRGP
jgi:hypothetical protein